MTAPNPTPAASPPAERASDQPPRRMRRALFIAFVAAAAGLTGAFASSAFSQGFGPPWQSRPFFGQTFDPAAVEDRADRMVRHLSIEVDATGGAAGAAARYRSLGGSRSCSAARKGDESRQRGRDLLTQTTIDRAAIESLRASRWRWRIRRPAASRRRWPMPRAC